MLLAVGAALLAYVGWQYLGTNWVSERRHGEIREELTRGWDSGQDHVDVDEGTADAVVRIPRFGDDYAVPVLEGTSDEVLAAGYGHFTGTADPGEVGNYALAAHRVTHGQPLAEMPDLEVGDEVIVETADTIYTYRLVTSGDALTVPFTAGWVLDPLPENPDPGGVDPGLRPGARVLTLTTCSELFHTDDRLVAFGTLVSRIARDAY